MNQANMRTPREQQVPALDFFHDVPADHLDEGTAWMIEASQCDQVALKNAQRLIHMQPMQIYLLQHTPVLS